MCRQAVLSPSAADYFPKQILPVASLAAIKAFLIRAKSVARTMRPIDIEHWRNCGGKLKIIIAVGDQTAGRYFLPS
jgi:hypothetical protein